MKIIIQSIILNLCRIFLNKRILSNKIILFLFEYLYFKYKLLFEAKEVFLLKKFVPIGATVIDVGANIGYFSLLFADWTGYTGKIIAIEPDNFNFERLSANVLKNNYSNRFLLINSAITDKNRKVNLFINPYNPMDHRISENGKEIDSFTIDYICLNYNIKNIDLIKIDVQGSENLVISGALDAINKFNPVLFIEFEKNIINPNKNINTINNLLIFKYKMYILKDNKFIKIENILNAIYIINLNEYVDILFAKDCHIR